MNSGQGDARLAPSPAGRGARLAATAIDGLLQAALIGGLGTVLVALLWMRLFPTLKSVQKLDGATLAP